MKALSSLKARGGDKDKSDRKFEDGDINPDEYEQFEEMWKCKIRIEMFSLIKFIKEIYINNGKVDKYKWKLIYKQNSNIKFILVFISCSYQLNIYDKYEKEVFSLVTSLLLSALVGSISFHFNGISDVLQFPEFEICFERKWKN